MKTAALRLILCLSLLRFHALAAPLGESLAVNNSAPKARVVTVFDAEAIEAYRARWDVVHRMVNIGITNLARKTDVSEAWRSFISPQDVIGIKVFSTPGPNSGTRPAVVAAVIEGLLGAGVPRTNIVVWDKQTTDLRLAGFFELAERYGVRVAGSAQAGYDETAFYDSSIIGNLVWGDYEFGRKEPGVGRKSFVSKLVSREITKIINISPLLNQNLVGVCGCLYGLAVGSVDNVFRFEQDAGRLATAIPEIYALPALSDKVALNIVDALICQYEGGERGLLHYSTILNELRFSRDPVALDTLSLQELERQREASTAPAVKPTTELYSNASLLELGVSDPKKIQVERVP